MKLLTLAFMLFLFSCEVTVETNVTVRNDSAAPITAIQEKRSNTGIWFSRYERPLAPGDTFSFFVESGIHDVRVTTTDNEYIKENINISEGSQTLLVFDGTGLEMIPKRGGQLLSGGRRWNRPAWGWGREKGGKREGMSIALFKTIESF
jgi:hypothetical protein